MASIEIQKTPKTLPRGSLSLFNINPTSYVKWGNGRRVAERRDCVAQVIDHIVKGKALCHIMTAKEKTLAPMWGERFLRFGGWGGS